MKRGKRLGKILSLRPIRLCNSETGKERRLPQIVGNKGKFHLLVESAEKQKEERSNGGGGLIKELDKEESKLDLLNGRPRANYRDFGLYGHILREILNASSLLAVAVEVDTDRASYTTLLRSGAASFQGVPVLFDEMEELIAGSGSWGNEKKRAPTLSLFSSTPLGLAALGKPFRGGRIDGPHSIRIRRFPDDLNLMLGFLGYLESSYDPDGIPFR
ncbi:ribosomal protein S14 [Cucumis melo var. makuwa]|uniref:Ribosomal protein S14 (Chloroplast) n=1 Tax=Cucumis melo var. makuwa TaxID=1194695 RepID=A0A5A7V3S9_CUCMM|nr:ribosomal protein S14 [Cucumis melo var. makuwa]